MGEPYGTCAPGVNWPKNETAHPTREWVMGVNRSRPPSLHAIRRNPVRPWRNQGVVSPGSPKATGRVGAHHGTWRDPASATAGEQLLFKPRRTGHGGRNRVPESAPLVHGAQTWPATRHWRAWRKKPFTRCRHATHPLPSQTTKVASWLPPR